MMSPVASAASDVVPDNIAGQRTKLAVAVENTAKQTAQEQTEV